MRRAAGWLGLFAVTLCGCVSNIDLDAFPVPYSCTGDAGLDDAGQSLECATGWRCGYGNRCFDPDAGASRTHQLCELDAHCAFGWRCGQRVNDERRCQELDAGAPVPCVDSAGCEGAWRCDTAAQRCVLVTDAVDSGTVALGAPVAVTPLSDRPLPRLFSAGDLGTLPLDFIEGAPRRAQAIPMVFVDDAGVWFVAQLAENLLSLLDGGHSPAVLERRLTNVPPGRVSDVVAMPEGAVLLMEGGGAWRVPLDGGAPRELPDAGVIRHAFAQAPLPQGAAVVRGTLVELPEQGLVYDALAPVLDALAYDATVFAVTAGGLVELPGATPIASAPPGGFPPGRPVQLAVGRVALSAPPTMLVRFESGAGSSFVGFFGREFGGYETSRALAVCPDGAVPQQFAFRAENSFRQGFLARCPGASGGFESLAGYLTDLGGANGGRVEFSAAVEDQVQYRWPFVVDRTSPLRRNHAAARGRAWLEQRDGGMRALVLDRQADTVVTLVDPRTNGPRIVAQARGQMFEEDPRYGLVSIIETGSLSPLLAVPSHADWVVLQTGVVDLRFVTSSGPKLLAALPPGSTFSAPLAAVDATLRLDGVERRVLLVSSVDTLWAADVTEAMQGSFSQPALFEPVLVPAPGVRLRALSLDATDAGSSELVGTLVTATRVVRFRTSDLVEWSLADVPRPSGTANPHESWTEGGQGRLGLSDGTVWSLPVMVQLSLAVPAVDGGVERVSDYARLCGDLFAATGSGLHRLGPGADGGLPAWAPVAAVNALLDDPASLRLFETSDLRQRLFIATTTGQVLELPSAAPCP